MLIRTSRSSSDTNIGRGEQQIKREEESYSDTALHCTSPIDGPLRLLLFQIKGV